MVAIAKGKSEIQFHIISIILLTLRCRHNYNSKNGVGTHICDYDWDIAITFTIAIDVCERALAHTYATKNNKMLAGHLGYYSPVSENSKTDVCLGTVCGAIGTVKMTCMCTKNCGGYNYKFKNIKWFNSHVKAVTEWEHQVT